MEVGLGECAIPSMFLQGVVLILVLMEVGLGVEIASVECFDTVSS